MDNKKIVELALSKGFKSIDKLIIVNDNYIYLWMCELQGWLMGKDIYVLISLDKTLELKFHYTVDEYNEDNQEYKQIWSKWLYRTYKEVLYESLLEGLNLINDQQNI